jgi:hypothetical protein
MSQYQELEKIKSETSSKFQYGQLKIYLHHRRDTNRIMSEYFEPIVEVFWRDAVLGVYNSLHSALTETFNAVRACRPGVTEQVDSDRTALLLSLSSLGELVGVELDGSCDTPEIETRMHPEDDRLRDAFKHWDDRPQVIVYARVSSPDRHNYDNEGIRYRIRMTNSNTTFEHEEHMSSSNPVDLQPLLVNLMIKHFA